MNKTNRKDLRKAVGLIEQAREIIEGVKEEEQEKFDNMPENLQYSEKGEKFEAGIDVLEQAVDYLNDTVTEIEETIE